jgi:hypothetical protein
LSTALFKVQYLYNKELWILNTKQFAYTQLYYLKKVHKKLYLKKHILYKQGLQELKIEKQKKLNTIVVESLAVLVAYQSPSANSFIFNPFFLILSDLLNSSTPIPFP